MSTTYTPTDAERQFYEDFGNALENPTEENIEKMEDSLEKFKQEEEQEEEE